MKSKRILYVFLLGSCVFEYLFFSPVNINCSRHMMPIYPLFSIFLAGWIMTVARIVQMERFWRTIFFDCRRPALPAARR